tara:strand:- start:10 stop:195 length:186 start_codon:yes stop_codon:yes gene_type:complete
MSIKNKGEKMISIEKDLQRIVDMWWKHEFDHWEENANPEDHIFHALNNIKNWLEGQRRDNE